MWVGMEGEVQSCEGLAGAGCSLKHTPASGAAESARPDRELLSEESEAHTLRASICGGKVIKEQGEESPPHQG